MIYGLWALLLISQSFSNTLVSRARNSSSLAYHGVASLFSNGVWFVSLFILVDRITLTIKTASIGRGIAIGLFYTAFTLLGSVGSHWFCMRYLETGKRSPSHVAPAAIAEVGGVGRREPLTLESLSGRHRQAVRGALGVRD